MRARTRSRQPVWEADPDVVTGGLIVGDALALPLLETPFDLRAPLSAATAVRDWQDTLEVVARLRRRPRTWC